MSNQSKILIYQSDDGKIRVDTLLQDESIWMSQKTIAQLFDCSTDNIGLHLKNIFESGELDQISVTEDFSVTASDGKNYKVKHYNLDAIISVGYRVNSIQGTHFRIWATRTLKQHLVKGYSLNQRRLQERGIEFEQAMALLSHTLSHQKLIDRDGAEVVSVISDYARSWWMVISAAVRFCFCGIYV